MNISFDERGKSIRDYMMILKRRRWHFIIAFAVVFTLAMIYVNMVPDMYRSTATILIEEQEVPRDLVRSTITSYAAQQIHVITQRVMTVEKIYQLIEKFKLYKLRDGDEPIPRIKLANKFRKRVFIDLVSADVIDPRSGRPTQATIAFTLSFDDKNPEKAKLITNELVNLYMNENLRSRSVKATGTTEFLKIEAEALNAELREQEEKLARFKLQNEGALPELYQFNLNVIDRTNREMSDVEQRLQIISRRKVQIESELTQLSPSAPVILSSGQAVLGDEDRLKALESEYRKKTAVYHDNHPDIKRLRREIRVLKEAGVGRSESPQEVSKQVMQQQDLLANLQEKYTLDHPKVVAARAVLGDLKAKLASVSRVSSGTKVVPDNPAYVMLDAQLKAINIEMDTLLLKKEELREKIALYEGYIRRSPSVEKDYHALLRDYNSTSEKYQDLKAKLRDAEVSQNLEEYQKGGHFLVIEPPFVPLEPESPNRVGLMFMALILSTAIGIGAVIIAETMDHSIRSAGELANLTGGSPLVVLPELD